LPAQGSREWASPVMVSEEYFFRKSQNAMNPP